MKRQITVILAAATLAGCAVRNEIQEGSRSYI
jgi:hypothetical protein